MTFNWSGKELYIHFTFLYFRVSCPVNQLGTTIVGHFSSVFSPFWVVKSLHFCHLLPLEISLDARETFWWSYLAWRGGGLHFTSVVLNYKTTQESNIFHIFNCFPYYCYFNESSPLFNILSLLQPHTKYENIWWYIYPGVKIILTQFCGLSLIQILIYFQKNCTGSVAETVSRYNSKWSES